MDINFALKLISSLILFAPLSVFADDVDFRFSGKPIYIQSEDIEEDRKKDNWSGRLGVGLEIRPQFLGSDEHQLDLSLDFKASYKERIFIENNKVGALLHKGKLLRAGVLARAVLGRRNDYVAADLAGLDDVDEAFEIGIFAGTSLYKLFLTGELYFDVSGVHNGFSAELEGGYTYELNSELTLTPIIGAVWGSSKYMQTYFGVEQGESVVFEAYKPDGGLYELYLEAALEQRLSKRWILKASARLSDLRGNAARSPIVRGSDGSNSQLSTFVAAVWLF